MPPGARFGVRVIGDGMEPGIRDGDVAFVEPSARLEDGTVGVFAYDGRSYIRRLVVDCAAREIRLEPDNPAREPVVARRVPAPHDRPRAGPRQDIKKG